MTEISRTIGGPEEVRSLLTKDLPQLQINEVLPIQTGRENFVVEVNGDWIFRFPRDESFWSTAELKLLQYLDGRLPIPTPSIQFVGQGPLYMGYPKLGHRMLGDGMVSTNATVITELSQFLCELHAIDVETAKQLGVTRRSFADNATELRASLERLCGDRAWMPFAMRCLDELVDPAFDRAWECLLHHDLHGDNVAVSENGSEIAGVIDFGDACIGDVHRDFKGACWHGFDVMHALVDVYETKRGHRLERRRIKNYFCVTVLGDLIDFSSAEPGEWVTTVLARSEAWLEEWAVAEARGDW